MVKNLPAVQETGSMPGSGRSPGEGNGNPLQYSCLENPMDRGAWRTVVHRGSRRLTAAEVTWCKGFLKPTQLLRGGMRI